MSLFSNIPDTIFRPLAATNRYFYAGLLLHLYDHTFTSVGDTPRVVDLIAEIGDYIEAHVAAGKELDADDLADAKIRGTALREAKGQDPRRYETYNILKESGWLIELRDRYRRLVDLSPEGRLLLRELSRIATGDTRSYGGVVLNVLGNLEGAWQHPDERSENIRNAWRFSRDFIQHLRTMSGQMRRMEDDIIKQDNLRDFFRAFFADYISKHIITDYKTLYTQHNPFRLRGGILDWVRRIEGDGLVMPKLVAGYVREGRAPDPAEAETLIRNELAEVFHTFDNIDSHLDIIAETHARIERRVHVRIRYMDRDDGGVLDDATKALRALGKTANALDSIVEVPGRILDWGRPYGPADLYQQRPDRLPIGRARLRETPPDPAVVAFEKAKEHWSRVMTVTTDRVEAFIERSLDGRHEVRGSDIKIDNVYDFIVFQRLREADLMFDGKLAKRYRVERGETLVANEWLEFHDFTIRRVAAGDR